MAIMAVFDAPEITKAQYDALRPVVNWEQQHPDGVILHSCAFDAQGGLHVVDLWESEAKLSQFFQDRLGPGFAQVGVQPPPPQIYAVHNIDAYPGIEAAHRP